MNQRVSPARLATIVVGIVSATLSMSSVPAFAQDMSACGSLQNHFGPYDYRSNADKHAIVERFHFNQDVENLRRGMTARTAAGDISYVLKVFPNHPRALDAMARQSQREKRATPRGSTYSIDCWFERGMRFQPDDPIVKMLYGIHLLRVGKNEQAVKYLELAKNTGEPNGNVLYNLGLAYVKLGRFEQALENAHAAYGLGFPLEGLRNQLIRAGKWREASPATAAQAPVSGAAEDATLEQASEPSPATETAPDRTD
ncbi:tetratricopeptide repeat protein [Thauera propionica]|uniref:tetratricopeptide repeat protein n=1 Tax=Thauera propionica TaxID=2019431 RepID=UPI0023F568BB|nr:hypothetical protein [Thauera propionica]MDD3674126.1 hypothetical protein [Thauera propionica]